MSDSPPQTTFVAPEVDYLESLFPGYTIESLIATGGMGAVYRANQKSLDRTVAIKILPRELSADEAFRVGFEAEAKAMARLNHPNLIGVYDFGEVDGMLYIIMEFVPGQSVFHAANGVAIDPLETIRLISGICNGLAHAHENGIVHRDIKPANILLDLNVQPKIGDFGLARPIEKKIQEGDEIFGTPHYTAPEVITPPYTAGHRADIFSVGVMLHELLTGKLPANDQRPASAIVRCDPRLDAIIRKATNPVPEYRYSSAAEITHDLTAIANSINKVNSNTTAMVGSAMRPVVPPPRRAPATKAIRKPQKESFNISTLIMLLLAAGLGFYAYKQYQKTKNPGVVIVEENAVPEENTTPSPDVLPPAPEIKPTETTPDTPPADHEPIPDLTPITPATPEPVSPAVSTKTPVQPKLDVDAFFARARKIMQNQASSTISEHDKLNLKNIEDYQRDVRRLIRRFDRSNYRQALENILDVFIETCKKDNLTIPKNPQYDIAENINVVQVHIEALDKQTKINDAFAASIAKLNATYIKGLEAQIERSKAENDEAAIKLIETEIRATKYSDSYFLNLMSK